MPVSFKQATPNFPQPLKKHNNTLNLKQGLHEHTQEKKSGDEQKDEQR